MKELPDKGSFSRVQARERCDSVSILESDRRDLTIFVVDDEELITISLTEILRREGFAVTPFTDPVKALAHMKTAAPDVLISDVMMPELSGIALAIQTRQSIPGCKILLISAAAEDLLRDAGEEGIGFRLLAKPLHPSELLLEIEALTENCADPC